MWKVGDVLQTTTEGWGFNITPDEGKPLAHFSYRTGAEADSALKKVRDAVQTAALVQVNPQ